jgi:hypothetical protein
MIKKLEYVAKTLLTPFLRDNYPVWGDLIEGYFKYLDSTFYTKIIEITKNNNAYEIYSELLDDYIELYFNGMIGVSKYQLTDINKRIYIALSKYIFGLKGNKKALEFLFESLSDVQVWDGTKFITIDSINIEYMEDESWWPNTHPYTYRFTVDESYTALRDLIHSVHPAGFNYEYFQQFGFTDEQSIEDEITMITTLIPWYNIDSTARLYDGTITYGGIDSPPFTF